MTVAVSSRPNRFPPPPLSRAAATWRYVAALSLTALYVAVLLTDPATSGTYVGAALQFAGVGFALWVIRARRRRPVLVAVTLVAVSLLAPVTASFVAWAYVSLATRRRAREYVPVGLLLVAVQLPSYAEASSVLEVPDAIGVAAAAGFGTMYVLVLLGWGMYVGARRDLVASLQHQVDQVQREQELRVLTAQSEERNRIAREMHDVLAHRISLVSLTAGALAYRTDLSPERMREVAAEIRDHAHSSLTELRAILGSLRDDDAAPPADAADRPQPTLVDVPELVDAHRSLGDRVDFHESIEHLELLPAVTGRHAYRIVQEALTNARKHAPRTKVTLTLTGSPGAGLEIVAANPASPYWPTPADPGPDDASRLPGSGLGLVGVAERAKALGGTMTAGRDGGRFTLRVRLPW